jgi:sugar phosphate permease
VTREAVHRLYGWRVVVAAIVGAALSPATLVNVPFALFIPALQSEFAWSRPAITAALSIFIGLLVLSLPISGRLVDRFGARRVVVPSIILYGVALASAHWLRGSLTQFYFIYGLIAVVGSGAQSLTYIRVLSAWFDRRRGLAIGACMAGYGLGYVFVPMFTQAMIHAFGWRLAYAGLGGLAIVGALPIVALLLRDTPAELGLEVDDGRGDPGRADPGRADPGRIYQRRAAHSTHAVLQTDHTLGETLRTREFWLLTTTFVLMSAALNGVQAQIVPLLTDRGMTTATAALMLSAIGLGSFPGRLLVGFLIDKVFAPFVAIAFYMVSAIALLWLVSGRSETGVFLCTIAIGVSLGAENDILGYLVGRYFGLRWFGQIYGALFSAYLVGAAAGPYLTARAYAATGSYADALRIGALAVFGSCGFLLFLRRYSTAEEFHERPH